MPVYDTLENMTVIKFKPEMRLSFKQHSLRGIIVKAD